MLILFDYLPSQNAWKIRLLLNHLGRPYRSVMVSIFEGDGLTDNYQRISPTGTVPAIQLEDGRVLSESNAILMYLADGSVYLPPDAFGRAKVQQWLHFEQERIESVIGTLRHWTLTGKLARRSPDIIEGKRQTALKSLGILEREFSTREFITGDGYSIADMSIFAYASRAEEAGLSLQSYPRMREWMARVEAQSEFLTIMHPYSIDPQSANELP